MTKAIYTLHKLVGGYSLTFGGEQVGRVVKHSGILELTWNDGTPAARYPDRETLFYSLRSDFKERAQTFESVEFKRTVADACAKQPKRRSPFERDLLRMAFGGK